jgi:hypothetical protein
MLHKAGREGLLPPPAGAGAPSPPAGASSPAADGGASPGAGGSAPTLEAVAAQAAEVGAAMEEALFACFGGLDAARPAAEYAERFRTLAMGLPRNAAMALNVLTGALPVGEVVRYTSEQLVSEVSRRRSEEMRRYA